MVIKLAVLRERGVLFAAAERPCLSRGKAVNFMIAEYPKNSPSQRYVFRKNCATVTFQIRIKLIRAPGNIQQIYHLLAR